jgi:hypothetical protein
MRLISWTHPRGSETIIVSPENNKLSFMHLPQSKNNNVNNMCIVVNPVHMNSEQGGVKSQPGANMCPR